MGYDDDLLYSRRLADIAAARIEAAELRQTVIAKGFLEIVDEGKGAM